MKRFVVFLLVLLATPALGSPPDSAARNAILIDMSTNTVLYEKDADVRIPPASMSKIMTGYMAFEAIKAGRIKLDQKIPISEHSWRTQGSKTFVELGNQVKVEDLIRGMAIQSGNDATIALAEAIAGTEEGFGSLATERARQLGLKNSQFKNATGLPEPEHYSTVRDLALIAQHIMTDFPEFYHYYSEKEFTYHGIKQHNRNPLLSMNIGADGVKTGHTDESGYCLIGSAVQNGRRLLLVIAGLPTDEARSDEAARLLQWGFAGTGVYTLFKKGEEVEKAAVWLGTEKEVPLTINEDVTLSMSLESRQKMKVEVKMNTPIAAPVREGQEAGKLIVTLPDGAPHEYKLTAGRAVSRLGFLGEMKAKASHFLLGKEG